MAVLGQREVEQRVASTPTGEGVKSLGLGQMSSEAEEELITCRGGGETAVVRPSRCWETESLSEEMSLHLVRFRVLRVSHDTVVKEVGRQDSASSG
jgi:hypothetical protein